VEAAARDYSLIVLDTISRAVPGQDFNRDAALFGDLLARLQTVALEREMSIVTVVHTRKPNGMDHDPVDDVLGSTQMTAAADCVLAIYREDGRTLLKGRARDMDDIDLAMQFDRTTICWQLLGETEQVKQSENAQEILDAMRDLGRAKASEIARAVGKNRPNTSQRLTRLWKQGKCKRDVVEGVFYYSLEDDSQADSLQLNLPIHPAQSAQAG
jgi:RecA-family ATPase